MPLCSMTGTTPEHVFWFGLPLEKAAAATGTNLRYVRYPTLREGPMSKQSEHLRDQARRTERLALTVSDDQASTKLKDMSKQFDVDADRLENMGGSAGGCM